MSQSWPWAVVLCRYLDVPAEPRPPAFYEDFFARDGAGGACDYWRAVTHNALDLTGSRVFGWLEMKHASTEVTGLTFPGDRNTLVSWGRDAAADAGIDLTPFRQVLVVQNFGVDHGAAGNGVVIVHTSPTLIEFGFIMHEMGHGFGLPHSFSAAPDREYGDGWDLMSFATTTPLFTITFQGATGAATGGLNARNAEALGGLPANRIWSRTTADFSDQVVLDPLCQPPLGANGSLVVKLRDATRNSTHTVEFRRRAHWDQALPEDAVVVHEVRTDGRSYLEPTGGSRLLAGQEHFLAGPGVTVRVVGISSSPPAATVRMWDLPEGSLRKEDSKPQVWLIENGQRRHIPSPAVLTALGRTWADVRTVPDAALDRVPIGPDVVVLQVGVTPYPVPVNRATTLRVSATDTGTGAAVAGDVFVENARIGATNSAITTTIRARTRRIRLPDGSFDVEVIPPRVSVRAPGYPPVDVDLGL
jgi:hypothetical protein